MVVMLGQIRWRKTQWRLTLAVALILTVFTLCDGDYTLTAPSTHFALTGDVSVGYQVLQGAPTLSFGVVELYDVTESTEIFRATENLPSTASGNIYFPCSYFDREGEFEFRVLAETGGPVLAVSNVVYVYWPAVRIASPQVHVVALTTAVAVTIYSNEQLCRDMSHNRYETNVALIYHGGQRNILTSNELPTPAPTDGILSDELPTGLLGSEDQVQFYCNSVDRAGFYTFEYQSTFNRSVIARSEFLQVIWSDAYRVSSPQENIFPCVSVNGLEINYEYPSCRNEYDKIRVFGQKSAFSRQPAPGTLEYITEERAEDVRAVYFFCEHFSKDYKGYCFKYVSTARNGAVDDQVMSCIPTNGTGPPLNGAWSTWSSWGECTVSCGEGVRYRYRLCNNPTPVNGGASCLGETVDSEVCPYRLCPTEHSITYAIPDRDINVVPGCNCGCILRQINGTISSSPGSCTTGFGAWKVLVADGLRIRLDFRSFDLYHQDEWLRVRDGADEEARVVAYHTGSKIPASINSTKNKLYLEYKVSDRETAQMRGFSAVYETFENKQRDTPAAPIPAVDEIDDKNGGSTVSLGYITTFVLIFAVFFCIFVIVLSVICTGYAGWKRKKKMRTEGREDSGLTAGFRSSASGHSIEPSARCLAHSGSSGSEISNSLNNKRGCPDGRFIDRSNLYMVKDETGLTYLPESNLSSPSHADDGAKQLVTIPEVPPSPYADQANHNIEDDLTKYEVTLPYHLGPGSVSELSGKHTIRSDVNATDLVRKTPDRHGSRGSHSIRGSQNSVYGSQGGATGISSRSHRSGSGSLSRFENSDSSLSRRHRGDLRSPLSPRDGDLRVLEGSEDPNAGGARRKRKSSPSGSHNSHSSRSHRSSHNSHNSHRSSHNSHQGSHKGHHRHRSRHSSDANKSDSGRRHKHENVIHPEMGQRPSVVGESPTTQGPRMLPKPSRMSFHEQDQDTDRPSPVAEYPPGEMDEHSQHKSKHRHRSRTPTPNSYSNDVFDIGYSANLGPRAPIWPGKSPSTECASDTNSKESRNSHNSSIQNTIETTASIEIPPPPDDVKPKKRGKHKKSRHKQDKRDSKSGKLSSGGSAEDDPKTASRLANHSNGYLDQDKTDLQSESAHSDPSVSSPLHFSYLNNRQRRDYMKSVFISDESLARTHSGADSAHISKTTTPHMVHRKLPDTPPLSSGLSSPSKSLTCVPIYSDGVSIAGIDYEFDDLIPNIPGALVDNQKQLPSAMSPLKKFEKPEKNETEKDEIVKIGTEKVENRSEANMLNGTSNGTNGTNGTKPVAARRTRPPRGPLSAASYV